MATADAQLPRVVADAKASQGRAAVEQFLDWVVPPGRIELSTTTESPRVWGGIRTAEGSNERLLQDVTEWFTERNIELVVERRGDHWTAIMLPSGTRIGAADYGRGPTASEAARDAKRRFETSDSTRLERSRAL
jgi:hypothetical protein